jgi:hypothetical protein
MKNLNKFIKNNTILTHILISFIVSYMIVVINYYNLKIETRPNFLVYWLCMMAVYYITLIIVHIPIKMYNKLLN